jgi:hypothetical protein
VDGGKDGGKAGETERRDGRKGGKNFSKLIKICLFYCLGDETNEVNA